MEKPNSKGRILALLRYLQDETDEEHPADKKTIMKSLQDKGYILLPEIHWMTTLRFLRVLGPISLFQSLMRILISLENGNFSFRSLRCL